MSRAVPAAAMVSYPTVLGSKTHAVSEKDGLTGSAVVLVTRLFVPLKDSAAPNRPDAVQVADVMAPLRPWPEASAVTVPAASLNPYATRASPVVASALVVVNDQPPSMLSASMGAIIRVRACIISPCREDCYPRHTHVKPASPVSRKFVSSRSRRAFNIAICALIARRRLDERSTDEAAVDPCGRPYQPCRPLRADPSDAAVEVRRRSEETRRRSNLVNVRRQTWS